MKDRLGLWILAGCAADAVSYESSRYGEGVLTYSLLQGMKLDWQKVLRRDALSELPEYLDISMLFNYAANEVPKLAEGIGGIQRPLIAAEEMRGVSTLDGSRVRIVLRFLCRPRRPCFCDPAFNLKADHAIRLN